MNNFRHLITCGLFLLLCAGGAFAQDVQTDYDRNFNLAQFKTYGFYQQQRRPDDPLAASPINERRIHDAIDAQLRTNGFTAAEQPDFWVTYNVTTRKALDIQDNRFGLWQRRGNVNVDQITEGTLVVVIVDTASKQEVWRGYATGAINPKDLNKDVNKAVTKLIKKFKQDQMGHK